jgi:hypothetical protein
VPRIHCAARAGSRAGADHNAHFVALMDRFRPKWPILSGSVESVAGQSS